MNGCLAMTVREFPGLEDAVRGSNIEGTVVAALGKVCTLPVGGRAGGRLKIVDGISSAVACWEDLGGYAGLSLGQRTCKGRSNSRRNKDGSKSLKKHFEIL